jgi:sodium-dependent dicarboxylate transporter 2/3/5
MNGKVKLLLGPALFVISLLLPGSMMPFAVRGALGTFLWMTLWWIFTPVDIAVTAFLPIVTNSVFGFVPMAGILNQYAADLVILLIGANIITVTWDATGLNERIALKALSIIGPSMKQQLFVWTVASTAMSIFLPNVVAAAALSPIAVAMLKYVGKDDVSASRAASNILLAIGWGAGIGGFGSPLGGGMNLVAIGFIEQLTGKEYMYIDWVIKMMPMLILITLGLILYMFTMKSEVKTLPGTKEYFNEKFAAMGSMSKEEKISGLLFFVSVALAFGRPLFDGLLPAFKPSFIFLAFGVLAFVLPGNVNGKLITWKYAQPKMTWGLFYMLAGGLALGTMITNAGMADMVAEAVQGFNLTGDWGTVAIFTVLGMFLSNVSSNTAACSIAIPIVISVTTALGLKPIPYVYITSVAANCAYVLPTSTRALPVSYGVKTDYLMKTGFMAILVSFVITVVFGVMFLRHWPAYSL